MALTPAQTPRGGSVGEAVAAAEEEVGSGEAAVTAGEEAGTGEARSATAVGGSAPGEATARLERGGGGRQE